MEPAASTRCRINSPNCRLCDWSWGASLETLQGIRGDGGDALSSRLGEFLEDRPDVGCRKAGQYADDLDFQLGEPSGVEKAR